MGDAQQPAPTGRETEVRPPRSGTEGRSSFRRRLALAAALGLVLVAAMTAALIYTAHNAREVVAAAQASHLRTRTFSALQFVADRYQRATYEVMRWPSAKSRHEQAMAAEAFREAIAAVQALPIRDDREKRVNQQVLLLAAKFQDLIDALPLIVAEVDVKWRRAGSTAAMREIQNQSRSYFRLMDVLRGEIEVSDSALRAANERAMRLQKAVPPGAVAALVLAALSTAVVFLLILMRLGPSLRRLENGVRAFAAGRTDHPILVTGNDEFTRLATSFNAMAAQIAEQQRQLRDAAAGLEIAVNERTADLERAHAELAAADQRRRTFFAEVSHELRTPITIIHGEAQVALRQAERGLGDPSESLERISTQSRELGRLVQDLFLIARAEADGLDLQLIELDLADLIERVASDFHAIASDCNVTVRTRTRPGLLVAADAGRLRQVLSAALDNALRHGGSGVTVEIEGKRCGDHVQLAVRDDGPGVDPGLLDTLLLRFRRGASASEGSGLGLTIVRALVEAHGGKVALTNRPKGGLELRIRLPSSKNKTAREERRRVGASIGRRRGEGGPLRAAGAGSGRA